MNIHLYHLTGKFYTAWNDPLVERVLLRKQKVKKLGKQQGAQS
jgi:hypothetical protein